MRVTHPRERPTLVRISVAQQQQLDVMETNRDLNWTVNEDRVVVVHGGGGGGGNSYFIGLRYNDRRLRSPVCRRGPRGHRYGRPGGAVDGVRKRNPSGKPPVGSRPPPAVARRSGVFYARRPAGYSLRRGRCSLS